MRNTKRFICAALALISTLFFGCNFWSSLQDPESTITISSLSLGKTTLSTSIGSMEYISVSVKPSNVQKEVKLSWSYDSQIIECDTSSSWGVTIKGLKEGQTTLRCSYNGYDASCLVTVSGYSETYEVQTEPYIYSNYSVLQTSPGVSEKVFVSLYGGDASDIDGYTWTVDNSSVASIQPTGQYCLVTAKDAGYARIKITHSKAAYPYYMGIYVFDDATNVSYITTSNNIVTMNQDDGDKSISVSLVNGKSTSLDSQFKWEIVNEDGSDIPVALSWNGNNALISPKKSGSCTLRVTHPDATYPLDILCRVITVVKNVYIQPDNTVITLSGENTQTVTCTIEGLETGEYNVDGFSYNLDSYNAAEIVSYIGNQVTLKGIANGSCKLLISHEKAAYSREVLVIVNGQLKDAVDASCYITTSQNYIRTKVGADGQTINISLKGGDDGDEADFTWSVKSTAADGSSDKVINLETGNGSVIHSRAAASVYSYGSAFMEPLKEGTAVITISHPKIVYPTEILVKVLGKEAVLEEPLYFSGDGILKILNGESAEYEVSLKGDNKSSGDDSNIKWSCDNSSINITPNGNVAVVKAPSLGSGSTKSYMTISHNKAETDKTVLILTADDADTLASLKALYSDKLNYNISIGESVTCYAFATGFDSDESPDFSTATWTVKDSSILKAERSSSNPLSCKLTGLKSGTTTVTVKYESLSCDYTVYVYPEGAVAITPEVYFTTTQNVVTLGSEGKTASVYVSAVNLDSSEYMNITWESEDETVATVVGNGISGTITAKAEGETVIKVTHPDSQNTLKIYVRIGSEYVIPETDPVVYISSEDVVTLLKNDSPHLLQAVLVNYTGEDTSGFVFETDNANVASISAQSLNGTAYIKPVGSGQAQITIHHTATDIVKKVLVVVGNSEEELAGYVYLTTPTNVVSIGEGNTRTVSVSVKNASSPVIDGYTWVSSNQNIVDVTSSGATAVFKANSIGTAFVTVTNIECKYSLSIIVQVVDPIAAAANPYIQLSSSVLTVNVSSSYTSITADLVGGSSDDYSNFVWSVNDTSICAVYGQNEVGKIRALKAGQTYVTVSHPKAAYSAQLLVVCDEVEESECYISVPSSIITVKPSASAQTVTASLVNGTSTDKYNFSWSLDVYDIIDFQYSANVCTITPKQTGTATITISHPKAAYDQQIIVNVQEYSNFDFPQTSLSLTQGTVSFVNMEVPTTSVTTHVEYSVDNSAICSISGTKAVAQITGIAAGTTTVRAKLVASSTGVTQAEAEMLVYVKEASTNAVYITSSSTIYTLNKDKSQTLSATLSGSGVTASDQYNLKWTTNDSDIIQITGISSDGTVSGQSIYITALKSGEALITCSHEKAASTLQFYVVVPGSAEKIVTLNKTYMTLTKGSSGTTIKATIENAESSADYYDLEWSAEKVNANEIVRIMGNGQNVTVYPMATGETTLTCQLPDSKTVAKCTVVVEAGKSFSFETSSKKVQPYHSKKVKYTVSPPDAVLTWTTSQDDDYFTFTDLGYDTDGNGYVQIDGLAEGSGTLACVTNGSAKGTVTVNVCWEYSFDVDASSLSGTPDKTYNINYSVNPKDANITVSSSSIASVNLTREMGDVEDDGVQTYTGNGTIKVTPNAEGTDSITIKATNKDTGESIGTKTVKLSFAYTNITVKPSLVTKTGSFSHYDSSSNTLYIGDGEQCTMGFSVAENVKWSITSSSLDKRVSSSNNSKLTNGVENQIVIKNSTDTVTQEYLIPTWYVPMAVEEIVTTTTYNGQAQTTTTYVNADNQLDPKTDFSWQVNDVGFLDFNADWYLSPAKYWKKEIPSKANTRMSISEYQATPWYWRPAHGAIYHWNGSVAAGPWDAAQTGNQPATLVNTISTTVIKSENTDILTLYVTHNGVSQKFQMNIVTETRNCVYNQ